MKIILFEVMQVFFFPIKPSTCDLGDRHLLLVVLLVPGGYAACPMPNDEDKKLHP